MKKYVMEIVFNDKPDLVILLAGNKQDMDHYIKRFKIAGKFNIDEFIGWIKNRNIFICAYSSNKKNLHAKIMSSDINNRAKEIRRYYSREIMNNDINENSIEVYDWKNKL